MRLGRAAAEAEAVRIAEDFFTASHGPAPAGWRLEGGPATPDPHVVPNGRKVPIAWSVTVRWVPADGRVLDGFDSFVLVDLVTGRARFAD